MSPRQLAGDAPGREGSDAERLAALWSWLSTWVAPDGGVNGPVVHRGDLKRMFAIHDTPWTQHGVIEGLLHLYRRSGRQHWLACAVRLGDAQCARQEADGRFRWAGHEDDRFSALVHNALADCALLDLADVLRDRSEAARRGRYVAVAEKNLHEYVVGKLYRADLRGFAMNPVDHYAGRDRFIVNMNSVAIDALTKLDRQRGTDRHIELVRTVAERIVSMQVHDGPAEGGLPYSDLELHLHIPLYTALALRGLLTLAEITREPVWAQAASRAVAFVNRLEDAETRLWCHKLDGGQLARFPLFVSGAGIICNGILDGAQVTGSRVDGRKLAGRLLRYQYPHGPIRNFIGYDHPDNGRRGSGIECWEDVYPTPNWNAQAFHFLCRVLPPPEPSVPPGKRRTLVLSRRYVYAESETASAVIGMWPPSRGVVAFFVKRRRYGVVVPGPYSVRRAAARKLLSFPRGRR